MFRVTYRQTHKNSTQFISSLRPRFPRVIILDPKFKPRKGGLDFQKMPMLSCDPKHPVFTQAQRSCIISPSQVHTASQRQNQEESPGVQVLIIRPAEEAPPALPPQPMRKAGIPAIWRKEPCWSCLDQLLTSLPMVYAALKPPG